MAPARSLVMDELPDNTEILFLSVGRPFMMSSGVKDGLVRPVQISSTSCLDKLSRCKSTGCLLHLSIAALVIGNESIHFAALLLWSLTLAGPLC